MTVTALRPRVTLGGSDAAAACGIDPWRSRVMLWLELTGRVERPETDAMRWGKLLEPVILEQLVQDGWVAWGEWPDGATDPERPWLVGHPDAAYELEASWGLLEIKTANQWAHRVNGDVPVQYAAQIQTYLHLTGLDVATLACLVAGQRLELRTVERDDHAIALLLSLMDEFRGYVTRDEPPPPDGSDSSRDALGLLYPEHKPGKVYRLTGNEWALARELRARREQRAAIDTQITELENVLKAAARDAETIITPHDDTFATWKTVTSRRLDTKALREQRPHIYDLFATETQTRRFTLI